MISVLNLTEMIGRQLPELTSHSQILSSQFSFNTHFTPLACRRLLICAKHLFVAAKIVWAAVTARRVRGNKPCSE